MAEKPPAGISARWRMTTIGQIAEVRGGKRLPKGLPLTPSRTDHPYLRVLDFRDGRIARDGLMYVPDDVFPAINRYTIGSRDVYVSIVGTVGMVGTIDEDLDGASLTENAAKICDLSPEIDRDFLAYYLSSEVGQRDIRAQTVGSTQPKLALFRIKSIPVPVPPIAEQRKIAATLRTLDDKIELNRRMGHELESIARAIFRSWFVDFDPVLKRMEGVRVGLPPDIAALFPAQMDEGPRVPLGWRRGCLGDLVVSVLGGDWGSSEPTEECSVQVKCVRGADIPPLQEGGVGNPPVRFLKPRSLERRQLQTGDIVVEVSGGSPTQSTGRSALVTDGVLTRLAWPSVCSNFCRVVRFSDPMVGQYVYFWLRWIYDTGLLFDFENGTTGIKNLAIADFALEPVLPLPPADVLGAFNRQVEPCLRLRESLSHESERLSRARDELLPWLLSGGLTNTEVTQ